MEDGEHPLQVGSLWRPGTASHSSLKPSSEFGVQRTKDAVSAPGGVGNEPREHDLESP